MNVVIVPDSTVFVQMGVVLSLIVILNKIFFKPIVKLLHERKEYVEKASNVVEEKKKGMDALNKKYAEAIKTAKEKALADRELIRKEGLEKEREILEKLQKEHAQALHDAKLKAKKEFDEAMKDVASDAKNISAKVAEKILQRRL